MREAALVVALIATAACSAGTAPTPTEPTGLSPSTTEQRIAEPTSTSVQPEPSTSTAPPTGPVALIEALFGTDGPETVYVTDDGGFVGVTAGESTSFTFEYPVQAIAGDWVASFEFIAPLDDLSNPVAFGCPDLIRRADMIIVADWCLGPDFVMFDAETGTEIDAPSFSLPLEEASSGFWYDEAGGTAVFMQFDAEGNLSHAVTDEGVDVVGDDYGGPAVVSNDGALFVYADYTKSPSPHYTDAVTVRRTTDGSLVGKWTVDHIVGAIQSDGRWLVITELAEGVATGGPSKVIGTTAINLATGETNRIESSFEIMLAR